MFESIPIKAKNQGNKGKHTHGGNYFNIFSVKYLKTGKYIPFRISIKKFLQKTIPEGDFIF
jgi:hypothetical protein